MGSNPTLSARKGACGVADSLFDPQGTTVLAAAAAWITGSLLGTAATILCVLAVAFVGLMLMSGRLAVRDGLRVVIGCFVLLGAASIAAGLRTAADQAAQPPVRQEVAIYPVAQL